jgi:MFS family permease
MKKIFSGNVSRLAVLVAFFINGAMMATWVSRIPAIQSKLNLSEGQLGIVLLGMSVGVLASLSLAGGLIARFGSNKVTLIGALVMAAALPFLALAPNMVTLWIVLFSFGAMMSLMDISMNEQAVLVERKVGKPLMSSFHAAYSVGGLAGALIGAGMASIQGLTTLFHFLIISLVFGIAMAAAFRHLLPAKAEAEERRAVFSLPERALWGLGAIAFCSAISEGAISDWSAVYLAQVMQTNASFAALGFAAYSLTMTLGRLVGDSLSKKWAPSIIVRFGGLVAGLGLLAIVLTKEPAIALIGFAAIGLGLANIIPLAFSAAGNFPGISAGSGIAGVATIGYAGFLAGPPFIGLIAENTSLRIALILVTVLAGSLVFSGNAISTQKKINKLDENIIKGAA